MKVINNLFGWFDGPGDVPAFDPGLEINCAICDKPLLSAPRTTISLSVDRERSYFYRLHKECATEENQQKIDALIVDDPQTNKNPIKDTL